jgi:hypothetical protein
MKTPFDACKNYGDKQLTATPKNLLIAKIVLQHLRLDGLLTPGEEANWSWDGAGNKLIAMANEIKRRQSVEEIVRNAPIATHNKPDRTGSVVFGILGFFIGGIFLGALFGLTFSESLGFNGIFLGIICGMLLGALIGVVIGALLDSHTDAG